MRKDKKIFYLFSILLLVASFMFLYKPVNAKEIIDAGEIKVTEKETNYIFTAKSQGKWIPIKPQTEGILHTWSQVYDCNKKLVVGIKDIDEDDNYIKNVKKTDTFYIKLPDSIEEKITVSDIVMIKDNIKTLEQTDSCTQSGQNKNVYQRFQMKKRGAQNFSFGCVNANGGAVSLYFQRNKKGNWSTVTKVMKMSEDEVENFTVAMKKGQYRIVSKASDKQIYMFNMRNTTITSKYQTKKSKAQKVKLGTIKTNVYTDTEKASRYYRVYRKTASKKRYIKVHSDVTSGNIKIRVYKKGSNRCLKTMTLKPVQTKTYRLKNGKGTYYIKVSKSGSKMSGKYSLQYK